ncbi:MAG TPA: orotidine-5'-phosphate decarboxylase [Candidatus Deferrimicrobium sp.]|nr:orotidine-5'-phosphate decarboxylase [Candidatus Deferrimicrobium sp.]
MNLQEKIIIALDYDSFDEAKKCIDQLEAAVFFKVGLQAFLEYGEEVIAYLQNKNKKLFLDLKFKDIPNTVHGAVKSSLKYKPDFLTIHAGGGAEMIKQALKAAEERPSLTILGVTILTSLSNQDLQETGISLTTEEAVLKLCELGLNNGLKSFVCSPLEIEPIKKRFGKDVVLVTPGIRPQWSVKGDQKRVFTPEMAVTAGSNYLVIGRPITQHENPNSAFNQILQDIDR